ncbi:efflux RND transporter periplasmic adaptor subunit [Ideonella azotifigens]|uniref:Efflux RND transporter periplasmic adaptor subunit n=2 Tax=Ideonella azotifigens TaxID=513160 RepID=A0ABN1K444_9BURK|nr:efflux RND transporter periplasmic adaptor subunit [Ideonella azotifigens]MCD2344263.1 efflux RND transporter periplasmic adaptor subunit [Ideonella azotifigens]
MQKRRVVIGGVVAVLVLGSVGGVVAMRKAGGHDDHAKAAEKPLAFTAREVVRPQALALPANVSFSGPLVAPNTVVVRAKAAGTLVNLQVAEGSRVTAGQRLGVIDLAELNARMNEREANAEAARATMVQAERTHTSNLRLAEQHFISPNAADASKAALDTARAQYTAAQAQVETVHILQRDAALVAPISGIVAKRHALPGEKVAAEQQLLTIVDLRTLEMAGSVGTHEVSQLRPGMQVTLQVEGLAEPMQGTLARIAPAAEAGTRSIGVTVTLANPKEVLRAGQFASARVMLPAGEPKLTVPVTAIASASGQDYVWTLEAGKLMRRTIVTGRRDAERGLVEVAEGLPAGAQVLGARFDNLREGAAAVIASDPASATATRAALAAPAASVPRAL